MTGEQRKIEALATALAIGVAKIGSTHTILIGLWAKLEEFDKDRFRKLAKELLRIQWFANAREET